MQNETSAGFRLSPQQARLWAAQQDGDAYRAECVLLLNGRLDPEVLHAALRQVVARHEILRTSFYRRAGMKLPLQVINADADLQWSILERGATLTTPADVEAALPEQPPPNLTRPQPLHAELLKIGPERHALVLRAPALCLDGPSLQTLVAECLTFCGPAATEGVAEQPLQYADFAEWQHQALEVEDEDARAGKEHWKQPALRAPVSLRLLSQARAPTGKALAPASVPVRVPVVAQERIRSVADRCGTSPAAVYLACWQALLGRLSGQTEVVVRCILDGRKHEETRGALGLYAQALPARADLEIASFADLVRQAARSLDEAQRWQEYFPGDDAPEAGPAFEYLRWPTLTLGDVVCSLVRATCHLGPFSVKLTCKEQEDCNVRLDFDQRQLSIDTANRIARYFERLLAGATLAPDAPPDSIDLLDDEERHRLLVTLNQTKADYPRTKCIHQLFEEQVRRSPASPALAFAGKRWTFAELNARSNQIAHLLRRQGARPGTAVGLFLERSDSSILGLLGAIKAGAAYLPLLAGLPAERLAYQMAQAEMPALITEHSLLPHVPAAYHGQVLCLDRDGEQLDREPTADLECITTPDDPVYVIFTSGSTGAPKGVVVRHRNLVNYTAFICRLLGLDTPAGQGLHFATVSTLAADLGNTCVFPSLVSGGCLHVISYETSLSGATFAGYVVDNPIDVLKITPTHLRALLADPAGKKALPRRSLVLGGEASSWELVQQVRKAGTCAIINHYGPTETTVGALTYPVQDGGPHLADTVPIGRPIANTQIYVLDPHGQPVPFGAPGELCIGGDGVARGYLGRNEETATHFVADPFAGDPAARMYKTGDRVRYVGEGEVEFLGRVDRQVKVHGFRVEPGEIESVLQRCPGVRQAVVVARPDKSGTTQLHAHIVPSTEPGPNSDVLREHLKQRLPDYMVPAAFVLLKALPLTANGKIDTRALPDPDQAAALRGRPFVAPRDPVEEKLAAIWKEVLGIEQVGAEDDFFDLGGHSLLATQVIARVQSAFAVQLPLRALFQSPTVAGLAEAVGRARKETMDENVEDLLAQMQGLSEEEVEHLLAAEGGTGPAGAAPRH